MPDVRHITSARNHLKFGLFLNLAKECLGSGEVANATYAFKEGLGTLAGYRNSALLSNNLEQAIEFLTEFNPAERTELSKYIRDLIIGSEAFSSDSEKKDLIGQLDEAEKVEKKLERDTQETGPERLILACFLLWLALQVVGLLFSTNDLPAD